MLEYIDIMQCVADQLRVAPVPIPEIIFLDEQSATAMRAEGYGAMYTHAIAGNHAFIEIAVNKLYFIAHEFVHHLVAVHDINISRTLEEMNAVSIGHYCSTRLT